MPRPTLAARRLVRIAVIAPVATGLMLAAGCGVGEPRSIDPAGVDGLEIPAATPDPADFVREIDNPYLPRTPGNVWYFGEDTTAYDDDGNPDGSWEAGVDGAQAGLVMAATPRVGDGYQQEFRETVTLVGSDLR